ncbi:ATP-binding protein [Xanthomonas nasturtii]|uniref:ATP-binding protein n=1 Tax=Xanthomonas nasturtii TaxID=1843581 RepID=UPI0009EE0676|nr:ATP-binding protein [Xanthomonas nasturtii]WVL58109.1 AAA family ATPase [Xanthomonas nasturtii]
MAIKIHAPSSKILKRSEKLFALQQDDWNDYSFQTLYHLYYRPKVKEPENVTYIGGVKILKQGQTAGSRLIKKPFIRLGDEWVSVGTSLDYYQRLNEIPRRHRSRIMTALQDAVANPDLVNKFENEVGWGKSIFRDTTDWRDFIRDARILYQGDFKTLVGMDEFSFRPAGADDPINFNFEAPKPHHYSGSYRRIGPSRNPVLLPERIIVMVGLNGSGKSTILSRLSHLAYASPHERVQPQFVAMGEITPKAIGFMRVITISYSAFDSFAVPGLAARDLSQITDDIESGDSRFVFCGLRDVVAEVRDDLEKLQVEAEEDQKIKPPQVSMERRNSTRLKSIDALANEFEELLKAIRKNGGSKLFETAIESLVADPSFRDLKFQLADLISKPQRSRRHFMSWSTGHKIVLHVIVSLVANTRPQSLVLFDEPETHLHPPLMAALMQAVRMILTEVNAYCVVATHSPVLLQETLACHVRYVRRNGAEITIEKPRIETFGENIGILTYDSFGLTAASTDYHNALDKLAEECDSIEKVETAFEHGLSAQARAYVLSKQAKRRLKE